MRFARAASFFVDDLQGCRRARQPGGLGSPPVGERVEEVEHGGSSGWTVAIKATREGGFHGTCFPWMTETSPVSPRHSVRKSHEFPAAKITSRRGFGLRSYMDENHVIPDGLDDQDVVQGR